MVCLLKALLFKFLLFSFENRDLVGCVLDKCLMLLLITVKKKVKFYLFFWNFQWRQIYYLSNLAFVAWLSGVMTEAYWVKSVFWYSWSDEGGDWSLVMAHESKKLAFDDHKVNSLFSLSFCSSFAPVKVFNVNLKWSVTRELTNRCVTIHWNHDAFQSIFQVVYVFSRAENQNLYRFLCDLNKKSFFSSFFKPIKLSCLLTSDVAHR